MGAKKGQSSVWNQYSAPVYYTGTIAAKNEVELAQMFIAESANAEDPYEAKLIELLKEHTSHVLLWVWSDTEDFLDVKGPLSPILRVLEGMSLPKDLRTLISRLYNLEYGSMWYTFQCNVVFVDKATYETMLEASWIKSTGITRAMFKRQLLQALDRVTEDLKEELARKLPEVIKQSDRERGVIEF